MSSRANVRGYARKAQLLCEVVAVGFGDSVLEQRKGGLTGHSLVLDGHSLGASDSCWASCLLGGAGTAREQNSSNQFVSCI